jgi:hypothetical protein
MLNITNIPAPRVDLIDPRTNFMSREWYRFFLNLFVLTGSGQNQTSLDDLQLGPPVMPVVTTNNATPVSSITVGASPFTYVNLTGFPADVMISGGGVSNLEFSRDGFTFFNTGSYYGMFGLSPSDTLRVTYVSPPTMTLIPR